MILLWGKSTASSDETITFLNILTTTFQGHFSSILEPEVTTAVPVLNLKVVVAHNDLPTSFKKPENIWVIETSLNNGNTLPDNSNITGSISWHTFIENIENFLKRVSLKTEITKEDIEVLYAIDPKLEELLKPFETLIPTVSKLPVAKDSQGNEIKKGDKTLNIKEVLTDYVKEKIAN